MATPLQIQLDQQSSAIVALDSATGTIIDASPACTEFLPVDLHEGDLWSSRSIDPSTSNSAAVLPIRMGTANQHKLCFVTLLRSETGVLLQFVRDSDALAHQFSIAFVTDVRGNLVSLLAGLPAILAMPEVSEVPKENILPGLEVMLSAATPLNCCHCTMT